MYLPWDRNPWYSTFSIGLSDCDDCEERVGVDIAHSGDLLRLVSLVVLSDTQRVHPDVGLAKTAGDKHSVLDGLRYSLIESSQYGQCFSIGTVQLDLLIFDPFVT